MKGDKIMIKIKKKLLVIFCLLLMNVSISSFAKNKIIFGYMSFPPYYETKNGKATGIFIDDYVKPILSGVGLNYSIKEYSVPRLYKGLKDGTIDVALLIKNPKMINYVLYGETNIVNVTIKLYHKNETKKIKNIKEINGKSVILLRGYGYGKFRAYCEDPKNKIKIYETDSHTNGLKMLMAGRSDYFMDFPTPIKIAIKKLNLNKNAISSSKLLSLGTQFLVSRKTPNAKKILEKIEKSYRKNIKK